MPKRIISLVPSQTELLYHLGLDEEVAGITKFCVHPAHWFKTKTRVGGTKAVNIEVVKSLQPDLILANKEENLKEEVDALAALFPVYTSDIANLAQALLMIEDVGRLTDTITSASAIIQTIREKFALFTPQNPRVRAAYLIWQEPYMTVGADTFIHDMLTRCGFENIFKNQLRYPVVTIEEINQQDCQILLLSSEPFPFKEKHVAALQSQLPSTKIILVDGEMFSWYGSRLIQAPEYFQQVIDYV